MGVGVIARVRKNVCVGDSLDCCHKVCVCVCGKGEREGGGSVRVSVTVWVWM